MYWVYDGGECEYLKEESIVDALATLERILCGVRGLGTVRSHIVCGGIITHRVKKINHQIRDNVEIFDLEIYEVE